jgi:hypothetical protein
VVLPAAQITALTPPTSVGISGTLPAFAATPTVNLGTIGGVATQTTLASVLSTLGSPMQNSGGSVGISGSVTVVQPTAANLNMTCANCSGSGASGTDEGGFTAGASVFAPAGGFFQTTATNNPLTSGQWGAWQMTANRAGFVNLRNASGTEIGTAANAIRTDPIGTTTQPVSAASLPLPTGAATSANQTATQPRNVAQFGGSNVVTGTGTGGAGIPRVTVSSDSFPTTQGVNIAQIAGSNVVGDPCQINTHTFTPINISSAANTKIVSGTASKKTYICHLYLFASAAENVGVVEGTGTNCGTGTAGVIGGSTAAAGINLAANQGWVEGAGSNAVAATATNADDFCLISSSTAQLSGVAVTVQQ